MLISDANVPAPREDRDQVLERQALDRLADRGASDPELAAELFLVDRLAPGLIASVTMRSRSSSYARSASSAGGWFAGVPRLIYHHRDRASVYTRGSIAELDAPAVDELAAAPSRIASSSGGCSYASSFSRQISAARAVVSLAPRRVQRSKFSVEDSSGR